jgi:hypothetical protein
MRSRAAATAVGLALVAGWASAEHEVYYRYVVLGFVKDARGNAVRGREVALVRDKTGFSYLADTDDEGFYVIVARLGDESAGETLTLKVGGLQRKLTARFDPTNHTDERGTRLDLEGGRFVERSSWFRPTLGRFLGTR